MTLYIYCMIGLNLGSAHCPSAIALQDVRVIGKKRKCKEKISSFFSLQL